MVEQVEFFDELRAGFGGGAGEPGSLLCVYD